MRLSGERKRELKDRLREAGLRATDARALVLYCLMKQGQAMSHAEVCEKLEDHGLDRATLYRNLMDLTQCGLARRIDLGDHLWRFELAEADEGHATHAHFVCQECGDVSCLPEGAVSVKAIRAAPKALKNPHVEIQVRGLCDACG